MYLATPMDSIQVFLGVKYFEIVILTAKPLLNVRICCTEQLPRVVCPIIRALLLMQKKSSNNF